MVHISPCIIISLSARTRIYFDDAVFDLHRLRADSLQRENAREEREIFRGRVARESCKAASSVGAGRRAKERPLAVHDLH